MKQMFKVGKRIECFHYGLNKTLGVRTIVKRSDNQFAFEGTSLSWVRWPREQECRFDEKNKSVTILEEGIPILEYKLLD